MPQLRFNEDGQWHNFVPEGGTGLKAGPWFPYLYLFPDARLSDHRVDRPESVQSLKQEEQEEEPLPRDPPSYEDAIKGL